MDGIHDLGGKQGFGKVQMEKDEPVFHARWESVVFSMVLAGLRAGAWNNTDRFRHAIERIDPVAYLSHTYYGRWLGAIETLLLEAGVITAKEIGQRCSELGLDKDATRAARPSSHPDPLTEVGDMTTAARSVAEPPAFKKGDVVVTRATGVPGHTRLPAYARGRKGRIIEQHGGWVFPDTNAHGKGEQPQHLYTVEFTGRELWGSTAEENTSVSLDLFEPYLTGS